MGNIIDGTGSSLAARVDDENKLHTRSVSIGELAHASLSNNSAFVLYGKRNMTGTGGDNQPLIYMRNDGSEDIVVSQVTISTNATTCKVELFFDTEGVTGGTERTPLNLNRGSRKTSDLYCVWNDDTLTHDTLDPEKEFLDLRLGTGMPTFTYDFQDSLILTPGADLFMQAETDTGTGDKVRANVYFYEIHGAGH